MEAPQRLTDLHWPTVTLSIVTVVVYLLTKRYRPTWPAAMLAILVTTASVWFFHLQEMGVSVVGLTQGGFPQFQTPEFELGEVRELVVPALNLAIVSFVSMMLTARSFAAKTVMILMQIKSFRRWVLPTLPQRFHKVSR